MKNTEELRIQIHRRIEQFPRRVDEIIDAAIAAELQQDEAGALTIVPGGEQEVYARMASPS